MRGVRWRPSVALGIVLLSVLGVLAGYQSSVLSARASAAGLRAFQDQTAGDQLRLVQEALVAQDARLFTELEEQAGEAAALEAQADRLDRSDPRRAAALRRRAGRLRSTSARLVIYGRGREPREAPDGTLEYDPSDALRALAAESEELAALDPARWSAAAAAAGDRIARLEVVALVFGVAAFAFALAELGRAGGPVRRFWASAAGLAALAGCVLWLPVL